MEGTRQARGLAAVVLLVVVAGFVVMAAWHVDRPGPYHDEVFYEVPAVSVLDHRVDPTVIFGNGPRLPFTHGAYRLMSFPYTGVLKALGFLPVAAVFGPSLRTLRLYTIGLGALALVFTYLFLARLFRDRTVALVATGLLAVDPSYLFYSRVDFGPVVVAMLAKVAAGWFFVRWWDEGRPIDFGLGALVMGIGLYDKANFAWIVAAYAVAAIVFGGRALLRRVDRRLALLGGAAFVLGSLPLLVYNATSGLATLKAMRHVATYHGGPITQLRERVRMLVSLLAGRVPADVMGLPRWRRIPAVTPALVGLASALVLWWGAVRRDRRRQTRAAMACVVMTVVVVLAAAATKGGFAGHHVVGTYPFVHAVLAFAGVRLCRSVFAAARRVGRRGVAVVGAASVAVVMLAVPAAAGVGEWRHVIVALDTREPAPNWSTRVATLAGLLRDARGPVYTCDWGLSESLVVESRGRLAVRDIWFPLNTGDRDHVLAGAANDPTAVFVLHGPTTTVFASARRQFFATVGGRARLLFSVPRPRPAEPGESLYEVYAVTPVTR